MITLEEIKEKVKGLKIDFINDQNFYLAAEMRDIEKMLIDYEAVEELLEEESDPKYPENIRGEYEEDYPDRFIEQGIQILEKYYPNQKLQAVKEFRDIIKAYLGNEQPSLKLAKDFMDFGWKEMQWENSIKGPTG